MTWDSFLESPNVTGPGAPPTGSTGNLTISKPRCRAGTRSQSSPQGESPAVVPPTRYPGGQAQAGLRAGAQVPLQPVCDMGFTTFHWAPRCCLCLPAQVREQRGFLSSRTPTFLWECRSTWVHVRAHVCAQECHVCTCVCCVRVCLSTTSLSPTAVYFCLFRIKTRPGLCPPWPTWPSSSQTSRTWTPSSSTCPTAPTSMSTLLR